MRKVDAVVCTDSNPARKDLLKQRVDITVAERPMLIGQVNPGRKQGSNQAAKPQYPASVLPVINSQDGSLLAGCCVCNLRLVYGTPLSLQMPLGCAATRCYRFN